MEEVPRIAGTVLCTQLDGGGVIHWERRFKVGVILFYFFVAILVAYGSSRGWGLNLS